MLPILNSGVKINRSRYRHGSSYRQFRDSYIFWWFRNELLFFINVLGTESADVRFIHLLRTIFTLNQRKPIPRTHA